ncbi:hypothetical protein QFZ76_010363 [Streptomyces sp. V4I2]|nr:hypothetical protein [Streptomyces sp. V4I2]
MDSYTGDVYTVVARRAAVDRRSVQFLSVLGNTVVTV